jgi:hypothetical protein
MLLPTTYVTLVRQFAAKKSVTFLYPPPLPRSPDLAPANHILFPEVKSNLKGRRFDTISDIQINVTSETALRQLSSREAFGTLPTVPVGVQS